MPPNTQGRSSEWVTNTTASSINPNLHNPSSRFFATRTHPNLYNFTNPPAYSSPYQPHIADFGLSPSQSTPYSQSYSSTNSGSSYGSSVRSHDALNDPSSSVGGSPAAGYFGLRYTSGGGAGRTANEAMTVQRSVTPVLSEDTATEIKVSTGSSVPLPFSQGMAHGTKRGSRSTTGETSTSAPVGPPLQNLQPTTSPLSYLHQAQSLDLLNDFFFSFFPYNACLAVSHSYLLEIVIPGLDKPFIGAVMDTPPAVTSYARGNRRARSGQSEVITGGRTVYVCLPPFGNGGDGQGNDAGSAKEGEVQVQLAGEGVVRVSGREKSKATKAAKDRVAGKAVIGQSAHHKSTSPPSSPEADRPSVRPSIDVRDHLTALLDLSADILNATELILVLNRKDRGEEELRELLHALAYVGGSVRSKRRVRGGFEWDERIWVLVGIEL